MTRNQCSDTFLVQKEFIVHNLQFKIGFCQIWQKSVVLTVKNHEKYGKTTFFDKNKKLAPNYLHLLKGEHFLVVKIIFKMQIHLVRQLFNCSCVYWKTRPTLSSKIRPSNHKILVSYMFRLIIEVVATQCINIFNLK